MSRQEEEFSESINYKLIKYIAFLSLQESRVPNIEYIIQLVLAQLGSPTADRNSLYPYVIKALNEIVEEIKISNKKFKNIKKIKNYLIKNQHNLFVLDYDLDSILSSLSKERNKEVYDKLTTLSKEEKMLEYIKNITWNNKVNKYDQEELDEIEKILNEIKQEEEYNSNNLTLEDLLLLDEKQELEDSDDSYDVFAQEEHEYIPRNDTKKFPKRH